MNDLIFEIVKFIGLRLGCFNLIKSFEPGLKDFDNIKAISIFENQKKILVHMQLKRRGIRGIRGGKSNESSI